MNRKNTIDPVAQYYAAYGKREWDRLSEDAEGAIEFELSCRALKKHLPRNPPKQISVLDIGGGPGRYTLWLAEQGYPVVLADFSSTLLDIAHQKISASSYSANVEDVVCADVRDLSLWPTDTFDAVLCMGPFYHLQQEADRIKAIEEIVRVLKPGGIAAMAFMTKAALIRRTLFIEDEWHHLADAQWLNNLLVNGVFDNDNPGRFNGGFGIEPGEIDPFCNQFGLKAISTVGTESISIGMTNSLKKMAREQRANFDAALTILEDKATDPAIHGMCSHLLHITRLEP